jgi:hypothetical protein
MGQFDDIRGVPQLQSFRPVDPAKVAQLAAKHPGIPADYLAFLEEIGGGGTDNLSLYTGPLPPDAVYDPDTAGELGSLLIISDDCAGYNCAFDPDEDWAIVEIDSADMSTEVIAGTFSEYIRTVLSEEAEKGEQG